MDEEVDQVMKWMRCMEITVYRDEGVGWGDAVNLEWLSGTPCC